MLDQLRDDLQHRLDGLLAEADKLRRALGALDSGESKKPSTAPNARRTHVNGNVFLQLWPSVRPRPRPSSLPANSHGTPLSGCSPLRSTASTGHAIDVVLSTRVERLCCHHELDAHGSWSIPESMAPSRPGCRRRAASSVRRDAMAREASRGAAREYVGSGAAVASDLASGGMRCRCDDACRLWRCGRFGVRERVDRARCGSDAHGVRRGVE